MIVDHHHQHNMTFFTLFLDVVDVWKLGVNDWYLLDGVEIMQYNLVELDFTNILS
jgi:hypothetical protein